MNEFRYWTNRNPVIARARDATAAMYRDMRRTRPDMARLLYSRTSAAIGQLVKHHVDHLYTQGSGASSSLHDLIA